MRRKLGDAEPSEHGFWSRVGTRIERRPRRTWVVTSLVLILAGFGVVALNANGLTNEGSFTTEQPSIAGEKVLSAHFPGGAGSPVVVIANTDQASDVVTVFADVEGIDPEQRPAARRQGRRHLHRGHADVRT